MSSQITPEEIREWHHIRRRTIVAKRPTNTTRLTPWEVV